MGRMSFPVWQPTGRQLLGFPPIFPGAAVCSTRVPVV